MQKIPVTIQNRHIHLSAEDQNILFGDSVEFTPIKNLGHKGQVVYNQTVSIIGKNGKLENIRVLGPCRDKTQVELSAIDAFALGIDAPVRESGDLFRTASCKLKGPKGELDLKSSVIIPVRHIHCNERIAGELGVSNHDTVSINIIGRKDGIIEHVGVRVHPTFALEFHLTTDEASEFWLKTGEFVTII